MKATLLLFFLLLSITGGAQNPPHNPNMEASLTAEQQEVVKATSVLTERMIAKDIRGLQTLLDTNFTLTHITGYVQPRGEWLREIETEGMKYYGAEVVSQEVHLHGNRATFVGRSLLDACIWGSRHVWPLQQTMQLEKRNGQWIILNSVARTF